MRKLPLRSSPTECLVRTVVILGYYNVRSNWNKKKFVILILNKKGDGVMPYDLTVSFHKGTCSSAHLGHNRRTIPVPHSDASRRDLNVCYVDMSLQDAYHYLFDEALEQYNSGKKPSRQISNYLEHIQKQYEEGERKYQEAKSRGASTKELSRIKSRYPKPFYEIIVSVGNYDAYNGAFASGGEREQVTVDILNEYMSEFQKRNPHLFVFSSHLHRDEKSVAHIHLDYISWTDIEGRGLPVRVSENGAFKQQGLTSGTTGDNGSIAFQNREREILSEIARKHGINIIEGKHSKKHLHKEEYILSQEKEKSKKDQMLIDDKAGELLRYQDELVEYLKNNGIENAFSEHIENLSLKADVAEYRSQNERIKQVLASSWEDYKDYTSTYFEYYRENKNLLWQKIKDARQTSYLEKKRIASILNGITNSTDFIIIKAFKLLQVLFIAISNFYHENELEKLQVANKELKTQARNIMSLSNDVSAVLKTKQLDDIEQSLKQYETALENAEIFINEKMKALDIVLDCTKDR